MNYKRRQVARVGVVGVRVVRVVVARCPSLATLEVASGDAVLTCYYRWFQTDAPPPGQNDSGFTA
jgi:hypothetical protein